jgi:signal transduction histidine kinase
MLVELSEEASEALKDFVEEATRIRPAPNTNQPLLKIVERNARRVAREHGEDRVSVVIEPSARALVCHPHLGRVIFNLLDNALHASTPSEQVRLFATAEPEGGLRIEILDTGPGIPSSLRERVFEPGFTSRRSRGGSGVGLTVAREILEDLGGTLSLASATPRGTCARINLPPSCVSMSMQKNTDEPHTAEKKTETMTTERKGDLDRPSQAHEAASSTILRATRIGGARS